MISRVAFSSRYGADYRREVRKGKCLLPRAIHFTGESKRREICHNQLRHVIRKPPLESELFGARKGALAALSKDKRSFRRSGWQDHVYG